MMAALPLTTNDLDEAGAIYQAHLDAVSTALLQGDIKTCMAHFSLPLLVRTIEAETLFEEYGDLWQDTVNHSQSLQGHGVTDYIRVVKRARRLSYTLIEGWHETHVLRHAIMMQPRYMSRMVLRLEDGMWKVAEGEHELTNARFPLDKVAPKAGGFLDRWSAEIVDARIQNVSGEPIYRAYLNVLTEAQNAGDYDSWADLFSYPCQAHYTELDVVFEGPAQMRPFFDLTRASLAQPETHMLRHTGRAEFIAADRIVGYHETQIAQNGRVTLGPIRSRMMLTLNQGKWRCGSVTNSLLNHELPLTQDALSISDELPTMREIQERMKK